MSGEKFSWFTRVLPYIYSTVDSTGANIEDGTKKGQPNEVKRAQNVFRRPNIRCICVNAI